MIESPASDDVAEVEPPVILPLVDALVLGGDEAPALLVQCEPEHGWAAVAVKPAGMLLVLLDARSPEPWDALVARACAVLRTERAEVLDGLLQGLMGVVLVGSAWDGQLLASGPAVLGSLQRFVRWIAVSPWGRVTSDARPGPSPDATKLLESLDGVVASVVGRVAKGRVPLETNLEEVEREGEAALAAEGHFRTAMKTSWPPVTTGLLVVFAALMLLELAWGAPEWTPGLARMGALSGALVREGRHEALLSYALLHGGIGHIAMNGMALLSLGRVLENLLGGRRLLVAFTLSALAGGIACALVRPEQLVVGASGGVFGLMTALLGLTLRRGGEFPALTRQRLRQAIGSSLLLNLAISLLPGVSLLGHAGGAAAGFVLGVSGVLSAGAPVPWMRPSEPGRAARMGRIMGALAILCGAALVGSVGVAFARGRPWQAAPPAEIALRLDVDPPWEVRVPGGEVVHDESPSPEVHRILAGGSQADPVIVEVLTARLSPEQAAELRTDAGLLGYFEQRKDVVKLAEKPTVKPLHSARAVAVRGKARSGAEYARWAFVVGDVLVDAEAVLVPGAPPSWRGAFEAAIPRPASPL